VKIKKVEINNSRSIKNISFEIKDLSILVGENNSGKSNILRAIELFYQDSIKGINEEYFCNKKTGKPISIIITFNRLTEYDRNQKYLKNWIFNNEIKIKKVIFYDQEKQKCGEMAYYGWQAKPKETIFDIDKIDDHKGNLKNIVEKQNLPDYFMNEKGNVTMTSYKEGVKRHIELGKVEFGEADWIKNPEKICYTVTKLSKKFT
jgi:predicted ATP-dependent endonuclease of OLD family